MFAGLALSGAVLAQDMTVAERHGFLAEAGIISNVDDGVPLDRNLNRQDFSRVVALIIMRIHNMEITASQFENIDPSLYADFPGVAEKLQQNMDAVSGGGAFTANHMAAVIALILGLNLGDDINEYQSQLESVYGIFVTGSLQHQLTANSPQSPGGPGMIPPSGLIPVIEALEDPAAGSEAARQEAERIAEQRRQEAERLAEARRLEMLRLQERAQQTQSPSSPAPSPSSRPSPSNPPSTSQRPTAQSQQEARQQAEQWVRYYPVRSFFEQQLERREQEMAAAKQRKAMSGWPAWVVADQRYASLLGPRTTEWSLMGAEYRGDARATDGQGNNIVGSFFAKFHVNPVNVEYEGTIFGLEYDGVANNGVNQFQATVYAGETDLRSGREVSYSGGSLSGNFYGSAGEVLGGTVQLTGNGAPNMSGHFAGVRE